MLRTLTEEEVKEMQRRKAALYASNWIVDGVTAVLIDTSVGDFGMHEPAARVKANQIISYLKLSGVDVPAEHTAHGVKE